MTICYLCGEKAAARANGAHYLCEKHALEMLAECLRQGNPVVMANKGIPECLIAPELVNLAAGRQSPN